ncbi:hypothetical protein CERSUDRAFT_74894 [Gelatoporia subvermispora B]|uniref:Uncharacterized protein n=1 Tax=Ceriporiopsis subvermispora (strain B) TaxID=914234 RepID=M2PGU6_CERS8|nr:hypothetical protein CERSUDRAFT_74894 [Gelatoporia subvermispora B]
MSTIVDNKIAHIKKSSTFNIQVANAITSLVKFTLSMLRCAATAAHEAVENDNKTDDTGGHVNTTVHNTQAHVQSNDEEFTDEEDDSHETTLLQTRRHNINTAVISAPAEIVNNKQNLPMRHQTYK